MKRNVWMAGLLLVLSTTTALAGENFVQAFLNRYRPPQFSVTAAASPQAADPSVQTLIREGMLPLRVEDMVRLMLENNLDVRVSRFSPLTSQYLIDAAFRAFEPTLRINASVGRSTTPSSSQLDGADAPSQLSHFYSVGYSQLLNTGSLISVDFSVNRNSSNNRFSTFNPSYSGTLTYRLTQPLLRNWGREITTRQIRVAQNNKSISELQFESQLIEMVAQGQQIYWDLVLGQEDLKVRQRSLELAERTLADNRRQVQVGTLAPIDVLQAEAEVAGREAQLVTATFSNDQTQDRAKRMITRLGDPALVFAKLSPIEAVARPSPNDVMPVEDAIRYALENRPDMRQLELEMRNDDIDVKYARNQLLPVVDINASYAQRGVGGVETVRSELGGTEIIDIRRGGFGDAFEQIYKNSFTGYQVGIAVAIPLSNKAAQSEYSRAMTQKQITEARRATLAQRIALEVRNAHSRVEMNRVHIQAAEKALELARRQLAAEEKKNQLGVSSIRFVLDEQRNVTAAETTAIQALVNYAKSLVDYDRAIGRTLRKNNIEIDREIRIAERESGAPPAGK